jgi:hypothetical protein
MKSKRLAAALLAGCAGLGLFFSDTGASASTINFSGTFFTATGAVFSVGEAFSGTINYDPATAIFLSGIGGTSTFAQYTESTSISVLSGATTYVFPLWEIWVVDIGSQDAFYFWATDLNTFLFITGLPAQSALLPPEITSGPLGIFNIVLPDSTAIGFVSFDVIASIDATPIPSALPLFMTGLGALGLLGWRRKRKMQAAA